MNSLENLMANDEFLEKLLLAKSGNEVKELFSENGITVNDDQIEKLQKMFSEKLNKIDIQNVSGGRGSNFNKFDFDEEKLFYSSTSGLGHGGSLGMWIGAGVGAAAGVVDATIKACKGKTSTTWEFIKDALKTSVKASFVGGTVGGGLGAISGPLRQLGKQSDKRLKR